MDTETGEMIIKRVSVPIGLEELMEGLVKEVLLKKPDDIYVFAARYFTHLLTIREKVPKNKVKTLRSIQTLKEKVDNTITHTKTSKLSKQFSIREDSSIPNLDSPIISQKPKMYNRNELKHNKRRHTGPSTVLPNNQQLTIRRKYARSVSGDKQESNNNKNKVYPKKQQVDDSSDKGTKSRKEKNNNNTKLPILAENNGNTKTIEDNNNSIGINNTEIELLTKSDNEKIQNIELVTESTKTVDNIENKIAEQTDDKSGDTAIKLENIELVTDSGKTVDNNENKIAEKTDDKSESTVIKLENIELVTDSGKAVDNNENKIAEKTDDKSESTVIKLENIELVTDSGKAVDNNENKIAEQTDDKSESTPIKLENIELVTVIGKTVENKIAEQTNGKSEDTAIKLETILTDKIEKSPTKIKRDSFKLTSSRTIDDEEVSKVLLLASKSNIENDKKEDQLEMEIPKDQALTTIENEEEILTLKRAISDDSLELNEEELVEDKENETINIGNNQNGKRVEQENIENKKEDNDIKETITKDINKNNKKQSDSEIFKEVINDETITINVQKTDLDTLDIKVIDISENKNIDLDQNVIKKTEPDNEIKTALKETNLNTAEETLKNNNENCKNDILDHGNITGSDQSNIEKITEKDDLKKFKEVPKDNENLNKFNNTKNFEKMLTIDTGDLNKNKINYTDKKIEKKLTIDIGDLNNKTYTATEIFNKKEEENSDNKEKTNGVKEIPTQKNLKNEVLPLENEVVIEELATKDISNKLDQNNKDNLELQIIEVKNADNSKENTKTENLLAEKDNDVKVEIINEIANNETKIIDITTNKKEEEISARSSSKNETENNVSLTDDPNKTVSENEELTKKNEDAKTFPAEIANNEDAQNKVLIPNNNETSLSSINENVSEEIDDNSRYDDNSTNKNSVDISNNSNESSFENNLVDRVAKNYVTYVIDNDRYLFDDTSEINEPDLNQTELKTDELLSDISIIDSPDKTKQSLESEDEDLAIIQNEQVTNSNKEEDDKNNAAHLINSTLSIAKTGLIENKVKTFLNEFIEGEKTFRSAENAADLTKIKNGLKKTTSFDSSKLREELKQVQEESKFTSFKTSYNPFLLRKEIEEAKPDEGSVLTSSNFRKVVDAVVIIQNGWIRYKKRKNINKIEESKDIPGSRKKKEINNHIEFSETAQAAVMIQKLWRGFRARKSINALLTKSNSAKNLTIVEESNLTKNRQKNEEKLIETEVKQNNDVKPQKETENLDQTEKRIFSAESTDSIKTVIFNDTKPDFHNEHYSVDEILDYPTLEEENLLDNYQSQLLDKISGNNKYDDFHEFEKIISPKSIDLEQLKDEVHVPLLPKNNLSIATGERKLTKSSKLEILPEEEENKTDKKDVDINVTLENQSNVLKIKEENISDKKEKTKSDNKDVASTTENKDSINELDIQNVKAPITEEELKINKKEVTLIDNKSGIKNDEENKNVSLIPENKEASTLEEEKNCNKKDVASNIENKESKNISNIQNVISPIIKEENKINREVGLTNSSVINNEDKSVIKNVAVTAENKDLFLQKHETLTMKEENSNKKDVTSINENKGSDNNLDVQNMETPVMEEDNKKQVVLTDSNVIENNEENKSVIKNVALIAENKDLLVQKQGALPVKRENSNKKDVTSIIENKGSEKKLDVQNIENPIVEEQNKINKKEIVLIDSNVIQNDQKNKSVIKNVPLIPETKDSDNNIDVQNVAAPVMEEENKINKREVTLTDLVNKSGIQNDKEHKDLPIQQQGATTVEKEKMSKIVNKNVTLTAQNDGNDLKSKEENNSNNKNITIRADIKDSAIQNKADLKLDIENKNDVLPTNDIKNSEDKLDVQSVSALNNGENKSDNTDIGLTEKNKDSKNNLNVQNVTASITEKENKAVKKDSGVENGKELKIEEENNSNNKNATLTDIKDSGVQNKTDLKLDIENKNDKIDVLPTNDIKSSEDKLDVHSVSALSKEENKSDNTDVGLRAKNKDSDIQNITTSTTEKENKTVVTLKPPNIDSGVQDGKELKNEEENNSDNKNVTLTADIKESRVQNKEEDNKNDKKNMAIPIKNKDTDIKNEETLYTFCSEPTTVPCENKLINGKPLSEYVETNKPLQSGVHETLVIPLPTEVKNKLNTNEIEGKSNEINDLDRFSSILSNAGINSGDLHDTVVVPVNEQNVDTGRSQPVSVQLCQTSDAENLMTSTDVTGIAAANDGENAHDPGKVDLQVESRFENGARSISCPESMQSEKRRKIDSVNMETQAATKIQAGFRGYQVRKQLKSKNGSSDMPTSKKTTRSKSAGGADVPKNQSKKSGEVEEQSAVKIQAGIRGFLVRRRQKKHSSQQA